MPILQHYYTSFVNKKTNSAGFQVKAMSSGISPEDQSIIARLITYRISSNYYEQETTSHPIALRYLYRPGQECILLCSQANGNDENGRPGNFFAHTLIMEPDSFTSIPPIFYWHSTFWREQDNSSSQLLEPLESVKMVPALDIEEVWKFLASGDRKLQFLLLMSAVVHSKRTQRRIVIIDTADNVALWIAAVSAMLPPLYRPLLSFATYHHDPYQSPFLITGTTNDSLFRAIPEEYTTYFILNPALGKVSEVDPSPYAELVVRAAHHNLYETQLLPVFSKYATRFPPSTDIDERLDEIATYSHMYTIQTPYILTTDMQHATRNALSTLEQMASAHYTKNDLSELTQLARILLNAYKQQHNPFIKTLYMRTNTLLSQHIKPTDENILELLKFCTESFVNSSQELSRFTLTIEDLRRLYTDEMLTICINSQEYLRYLNHFLTTTDTSYLFFVWQYLGDYLVPSPHSQPLLLTSLRVLDELWKHRNGEKLFQAMYQAFVAQGQGLYWFSFAVEGYQKLPQQALELFYCKFVCDFELESRIPYRNIVQPVIHDIIVIELNNDIDANKPEIALLQLECWVKHSIHFQLEPANLVQIHGLPRLESRCSPQEWQKLIPKILTSAELAPLLSIEIKNKYLQNVFSTTSFASFSPEKITLYKKYQNDPILSVDVHTVASLSIELASGQLDTQLIHPLHTYIETLPPEKYHVELNVLIDQFFKTAISENIHNQMIYALFIPTLKDSFWKIYWQYLITLLSYPSSVTRVFDIISYWFTLSDTSNYLWQNYILQDFFLQLPFELARIKKSPRYNEFASVIDARASKLDWYPSIRPFIVRSKSTSWPFSLPKFGQNSKKDESEQVPKQLLATKIAEMFEYKHLCTFEDLHKHHTKNIAMVYRSQHRELFWRCYWNEFEKLLTQHHTSEESFLQHVEIILRLLDFWFDASMNELGHIPYVVQEFFPRMPHALITISRNQEFREIFHTINKTCKKDYEKYRWWPLIVVMMSKI